MTTYPRRHHAIVQDHQLRKLRAQPKTLSEIYDYEEEPEEVSFPALVSFSLSLLLKNARSPGSVRQNHLFEAADIVENHFYPPKKKQENGT